MLLQYLISIDARLRRRNSTVSVKAETAERLESRLFMYIMNNSDIYTFQIRVNAYIGASIHLILIFVSNHGKQLRNMVNKTEESVEFTKGIFSMHN